MFQRSSTVNQRSNLLLWLGTASAIVAFTVALYPDRSLWAQSPDPLAGVDIPTNLEPGTTLSITSSESMRRVNGALRSRFSDQFGDVDLQITYDDSDTAIQALLDGNTDVAAIGRNLTDAEIAAGLQEVPVTRSKIAILIGPNNPFEGSLTVEQFAQIFRGEITNWSEVGGPNAPIVLVDRPVTSDTRQAFQNYPVFQSAPFVAANGAITPDEDSTSAVIDTLGDNGISYAIVEQVLNNPAVRIVPMHDTLPDDEQYPFSQPLNYAYNANDPSSAALAFLGFAVRPENAAAIAAAPEQELAGEAPAPADPADPDDDPAAAQPVAPEPAQAESVEPAPIATEPTAGPAFWPWLLALPILGGLLWWLLKGQAPVAAPVGAAAEPKRIILTPRNCRDAYAYWEIPESEIEALRRQNYDLALQLQDVTDMANGGYQSPHSTRQFDCDTVAVGDKHLPIAQDNRDYLVELGYRDEQDQWQALVRSDAVRVPACVSFNDYKVTAAGAAAVGAAGLATSAATQPKPELEPPARAILTPRDSQHAYAYWELPPRQVKDLKANGCDLKLRLYDVTTTTGTPGVDYNSMQQFDGELATQGDLHLPIAISDRDYQVDVGYMDPGNRWQSLARSEPVQVPAAAKSVNGETALPTSALPATAGRPNNRTNGGLGRAFPKGSSRTATAVAGGATAAVVGAVANRAGRTQPLASPTLAGTGIQSDEHGETKLILVPRSQTGAYAYWEIAEVHRQALKNQGGQTFALRIHDATNLELDYQAAHRTEEYSLHETDPDRHVTVPIPDRDYVAELGYLTADGQWLRLVRSLHVRVPAA